MIPHKTIMVKILDAYRRYKIIDKCIREMRYPSIEKIMDKLEEVLDKPVSKRTVQQDLKDMREDQQLAYNAPIKFDKLKGGYYYTEAGYSIVDFQFSDSEIDGIEIATQMLQPYRELGIIDTFNKAVDRLMETIAAHRKRNANARKIVQFEKGSHTTGTEFITQLLEAIRMYNVIVYDYFSYEKQQTKRVRLHPYLLKECRNRWYIIGWNEEYKQIRTYGLDRMSKLKMDEKAKFHFDDTFNPDEFFKYSFGITIMDMKPEKFVFSMTPQQSYYFKSHYIHDTQRIIKETKTEVQFEITCYPSFELKHFIRGHGDLLKVIKPEWLVKELKGEK